MTPVNPDETVSGADWIKRGAFDLAGIGVNSVDDLRLFLEGVGMTVEHFKTLETYKSNVERVPWLREL